MNAIILWLIGLVLIYIEFYLPGAILGIAGGLFIIASLFLFAMEHSISLTLGYFLLLLASVGALIKYALWRIPRVKPERSIYSADAQVGYQASSFDEKTIGKEGIVLSDLKPGGYIVIDGNQHQAISEGGYIPKGSKVIVLRGEGESLIVRSN